MIYLIAILAYVAAFWIGWIGGKRAGMAEAECIIDRLLAVKKGESQWLTMKRETRRGGPSTG